MKQRMIQRLMLGVALLAVVPIALPHFVGAQSAELTEAHLEKIRQNCVDAQVTMQRVQLSDIGTRINFGRAYDGLVTELMTPLNNRMAVNRMSAATVLAERTTEAEDAVDAFRDDYVEYTNTLTNAIRMPCQERPADFYVTSRQARELRAQLAADVGGIRAITTAYEQEVINFANSLPADGVQQ